MDMKKNMNVEEFERFLDMLSEHGYKKGYDYIHKREQWYKSFGRDKNLYEEGRSLYQVFVNVFDWRPYHDMEPDLKRFGKDFSVTVTVMVSRTIDEVPISLDFDGFTSVRDVEEKAKHFYIYVNSLFTVPPKEEA